MPFTAFDFQILDKNNEVVRDWRTATSLEEMERITTQDGVVRRSVMGLTPGEEYCVRARCTNDEGASEWCEPGCWARMPPDAPKDPAAPTSEFTSISWVELRFVKPYDGGAAIDKFGIRTSPVENPRDDDWRVLTEQEVGENIRAHKAPGVMVCRVCDLKPGSPHFFSVRVGNSVGWSNWSETACFVTKPGRPGRVTGVGASNVTINSMSICWQEPNLNGLKATRYELIFGSSRPRMRWAQLVGLFLTTTPDTDRIFGELVAPELGKAIGQDAQSELVSEENLYMAIGGDTCSHTIEGLLPAQEYYFAVRVVSRNGRGEFSDLFGPVQTGTTKPFNPMPPEAQPISHHSCRILLQLPYDCGFPILEAGLTLTRSDGPLAHHELDQETGEAQDHIARREVIMDPKSLPTLDLVGASAPPGQGLAGCTEALWRSYRNEGLDPEAMKWDGCQHSSSSATGRRHIVLLENLMPGNFYRVQWCCCNKLGWSQWTLPDVRFCTEAWHPDRPLSMEVHDLL
mmetsp:Transcript_91217/g.285323  ORF Transcript_91217/g.285323 Transcript_91217/m.285323 type:complete len:514 (-) Transcript_91217:47-1588(-)